jgi:gliding motility-associated-like protein
VLYKSWTPVTVNLNKRAGHTIQVEFTTEDCSRGGHFGYAYVDVDSDCDQPLRGAGYCIGDPALTLEAPFGFERYAWYVNRNFGTAISNNNRLVLSPPPADGTQYSLVLKPYEGYGCEDTLHTIVRWGSVPRFNITGIDAICLGDEIVMDAGFTSPDVRFKWSPSFGLSNPDSSSTRAKPVADTRYVLAALDKQSGCTVKDTFSVRAIFLDTVLRVSGDTIVCGNNPYTASFKANGADITWYRNGQVLPPPSVPDIFTPNMDGRYYAIIRDAICAKQTNTVFVRRRPKPTAQFSILRGDQCFLNHEISVAANAAGVYPVKWQWALGDGRLVSDSATRFAYPHAGMFRPMLTVTSLDGCKDTISKHIQVFAPPEPRFDIDNACVATNTLLTNRTIIPAGDQVKFMWNLGNGVLSNQQHVATVYEKPGIYTIVLGAVSDKCAEDTVFNIRRVNVQYAAAAKKRTINTALGYPAQLSTVNKGIAYRWTPFTDLSSDTSATPEYTGNSDRQYLVRVTSPNGCFVMDTVQLRTFNQADILVPTAFTPNKDGRNDRLRPITAGVRNLQYFRIWNRWGQLVYQSATDLPGWDGTYAQLPAPAGTYVWEVKGVDTRGYPVQKKGTVVLIR